jgi:PAS domain S-box-containing protein
MPKDLWDNRLESKKQEVRAIRDYVDQLEKIREREVKISDSEYKIKYNELLKRFHELEKIHDFHRGITQNISSGILTTDENGRITFMNRAALEMFGYEYLKIQGQHVSIIFNEKKEASIIINNTLQSALAYESSESVFVDAKGQMIAVGFSTSLLRYSEPPRVEGVIFRFKNIEMVRNMRKQIERMDRLATLGELAAGIAHEIRNPLAGIKTSAQVLEESFSPGDYRSQLISRIVKEIDRSNALLKRFFNFAKPSRPKQDFHNIEMIIDSVYLLLAPRLKKCKISFTSSFAPDTPLVYVDDSQIEQVILNLFMNAIDVMKDGGKLHVETGINYDSKTGAKDTGRPMIQIIIGDTGCGIEKDKQEKIFNPFYTTKSDGTGLGLSISSRLLQENGGKIDVRSEPGKGAEFIISLPVIERNGNGALVI